MRLFTPETTVGIFSGLSEGGLEFHADLVLDYRSEYQRAPMHGQFVAVALEHQNEAVLGRITSISSTGDLAGSDGEELARRAHQEGRPVPENLRERFLKYRTNIRVLGVLRNEADGLVFVPSCRRVPHMGSAVAFLAPDVLQEVAGHNVAEGTEIGFLAFGEFIYAGADPRLKARSWMQVREPPVVVKFPIRELVGRRTFLFARSGFGKTNTVKQLMSNLYKTTPTVNKRGGQKPVGTIIFDLDGEYPWPDDKGRPGLCDVKHLDDKLVLFTSKSSPSGLYRSFVAGGIKLDLRTLPAAAVLSVALESNRQEQQNVLKMKGLSPAAWQELVDVVHENGNGTDPDTICRILQLEEGQTAEWQAARSNMTRVVRMLHDPYSLTLDVLRLALREGKLCVFDLSQLRGSPAHMLSALILQYIFNHNQHEFTKAQPDTLAVIAVIEEAQAVLAGNPALGTDPYVIYVKEGRKYDLGALLITQQPGSIPKEILSQGDTWFIFHLLSAGDLKATQDANAHFSKDLLASLLNEPLSGNGVFWSGVAEKSYPIPIRPFWFESEHALRDPEYRLGPADTVAQSLRRRVLEDLSLPVVDPPEGPSLTPGDETSVNGGGLSGPEERTAVDVLALQQQRAIEHFRGDAKLRQRLEGKGAPWRTVLECLKTRMLRTLPDDERGRRAHSLVERAMGEVYGAKGEAWTTESRESQSGRSRPTCWIVLLPR